MIQAKESRDQRGFGGPVPRMTRVLIVSDVRLYREGLVHFLGEGGQLEVVGTAADAESAVDNSLRLRPDSVLLDMSISDPLAAVRMLRIACPTTKVLALGLFELTSIEIIKWAEAGIAGYVSRDASVQQLEQAVRASVQDELQCSAKIAGALLQHVAVLAERSGPDSIRLTPREEEIVSLLGKGLTNKEIAGALAVRVATVKNHVHSILEKLGSHTRGEAVARARALGICHPSANSMPARIAAATVRVAGSKTA